MRALVLAGLFGAGGGCGFSPIVSTAIVEHGIDGFTGDLSGGSVASRGAIEPDTYFPGGLRARGYHNEGVTAATTSADLAALFTQPSGQILGWNFAAWGDDVSSGYPHGLGLANHDHWSVVIDGEIWLPVGPSTYTLAADDAGFVEINVDGAITSAHASFAANGTLTITTAHDGWYPIKGAMSENIGNATFYLQETAPVAATVAIPPSHLRAKTTDMRGLVAYLYFLQELELGPAMWLDPGPIDHDAITPGPADYGFTTTFSERLAGQILVDTAGAHAFAVDADDSYRLFVDGQLVADHWLTLPDQTGAPDLAAGWHTIALDYGNDTGAASLHLRMDGAVVAADHLRPTVAWGVPINAFGPNTPVGWSDQTPGVYEMKLAVGGGEVIDTTDVEYAIAGPRTGIAATVDQGGAPDPLAVHGTPNEADLAPNLYDYEALHSAFVGTALAPTWHLTVTSSVAQSGTIVGLVMASYHGGPLQPFAPDVVYTSQPHATPGAKIIEHIHVDAVLAAATMTLAVRTAGSEARLASAAWTPVDNDGPVPIAGDEFIQYQLTLAGDGWTFPSVERVELDYH
jgi:hypothetical protein